MIVGAYGSRWGDGGRTSTILMNRELPGILTVIWWKVQMGIVLRKEVVPLRMDATVTQCEGANHGGVYFIWTITVV